MGFNKRNISYLLLVLLSACLVNPNNDSKNKEVQETTFEPTIESLQKYNCPDWFRDAKFGIYLHWGPYSVAEQGEWYARKLYDENTSEYRHHIETYGHPSEFGYKDFIPLWKAENFDPDRLLALFKKAGAKYFTPCAVHHDNFDLWDSEHHNWNALNMGPKKDLIKLWKEAAQKAELHFGVTTHLSRSYSWLNTANGSDSKGPKIGVPYDGAQGKGKGLYPPIHEDVHQRAPIDAPKEWREFWKKRIIDLIDKYEPEHLYFDCAVPFRGEDNGKTGLEVISHLYNSSARKNGGKNQAVMAIKERPWQGLYADGIATLDFERGKAASILEEPWQTDDSMGSWGYNINTPYTTSGAIVDKLIDIVSKNGNLLLNVPIRADGTLDDAATKILEEIGAWMEINGEAIYETRPWYVYGKGPTNEIPHKVIESPFTKKDIRFTTKEDTLYLFVLDWPGAGEMIEIADITLMNTRVNAVAGLSLLGSSEKIEWEQHPDGLRIIMPDTKPCAYACTFKIKFDK